MAYPRRCPLCAAAYAGSVGGRPAPDDARHATVRSAPGGTPSRWRPELPGRLLVLACRDCRGEYAWDYFAGRPPPQPQDRPSARLRAKGVHIGGAPEQGSP